jgi:hypothetical protein
LRDDWEKIANGDEPEERIVSDKELSGDAPF